MSRAEALRLTVAVAVAAGAVVLGESLSHGSHHSHASASRSGSHAAASRPAERAPAAGSVRAGGAGSKRVSAVGGSPSRAGGVAVAGGPAVERSLAGGSMTVVVDQPPPGLFSEQNASIAQGAEVAVGELNAAGGLAGHVHIKLVRQTLDGLSPAAVQSRLRSEAAAALVLPCDTNSQLSLAAGASRWGLLMLAPCNPDATAGRRYATYWPVGAAATDEAAELTTFMRITGYASAFVVSVPGNRYVELLTGDFRSAARASGIKLRGSASMAATTTDFSGLASTIRATRPRPALIFTALPPPLVNRLAAGLRENGVEQTIIGTTAMDTPLTLSSGSKALENATFASYGFPRESAAAARFAAAYRALAGHQPVGSFPGLGLETIRLLESAARKAGSAEPSAIQRALAGGVSLEGVGLAGRTYQPGGDHNPVGEVAVSKISMGSFLPLLASIPTTRRQ